MRRLRKYCWILPILLGWAQDASAQLIANGKSLTVTTANSVATFTGADLTGFTNQLTNENYLKLASTGQLAAIDTIAAGQTLQTSNWVLGTDPNSGVPNATITVSDATRSMTLKVKIDTASQETVVTLSASITNAGLRNASWSIAGLDLAGGHLIVPGYNGLVFDKAHTFSGWSFNYPTFVWNAQMGVYETAQGSFVFYSTDPLGHFKQLRGSTRGSSTVDVAIATEAVAPFTTATSTPSIEWRLKAFSGDWRNAAQAYRNWLLATRPPVSDSAHPWVSGIRSVVGVRSLDQNMLVTLATRVTPSKTLLYVFDWRAYNYDVNYPDYTPRSGVDAFITAAHSLGFKVMLHFDAYGVSPGNPDYASVQAYQARTPETLQLDGWFWDRPPSTPGRFAYINPASSVFRALLVARIGAALNAVHPDAIHLDVSSALLNDGNGLIEGLTFSQGAAQLHQDLIAAFPGTALAGEGENDVLYRYHSFAQTLWLQYPPMNGHPITAFLFNQKTQYYGHLGQPAATDPGFKVFLSRAMRRGVLPMLWSTDLDTNNPDMAREIALIQSWQTNGFQLDMNGSWAGALVRFIGSGNSVASLTDTGTLETLTAAGATLYQLGHDATRINTSTSVIPGWPAFDATAMFGLDPAQQYWLTPGPRPDVTHITSLPDDVRVGSGTLVVSKAAHIELNRQAAAPFSFLDELQNAVQGVAWQGSDFPLAYGASAISTYSTVGGVQRPSLFMHPPFQGQPGGETFAQWAIPLGEDMKFQFANGILDGAACNVDGLTFRVTVNGTEVYRQTYSTGAWHNGTVDLSTYANSTIQLRLINNPGPQNNANCDWGAWSLLQLVHSTGPASFISIPMTFASGSAFSGISGDGSLSMNSSQSATVSSVPLPGRFTVFTQAGTAVANGNNLANLSYQSFTELTGTYPESAIGCCNVGSGTVGGVTKTPGIPAHPPVFGRTILSWVLRLPDTGSLRLGWSTGILDPARTEDGVDFLVLIDGIPYWTVTHPAYTNAWVPGSLDLSPWRGKNILVELVTDSRSTFNYDWAEWADLVLSNSVVACSYSLNPTSATVGAAGGQATANVSAPATCPWFTASGVPWLSVASGGSGTGNGVVSYAVDPNSGAPRFGSLTIGGKALSVSQTDLNGVLPKRSGNQLTSQ